MPLFAGSFGTKKSCKEWHCFFLRNICWSVSAGPLLLCQFLEEESEYACHLDEANMSLHSHMANMSLHSHMRLQET